MTFPPVIRLFFAIELSASVKEKIEHFVNILKQKSKSKAIRWTMAENLHITLQFLPSVQTKDLQPLVKSVQSVLNDVMASPIFRFGDVRLFPSTYHPRVITLDILPEDALTSLSVAIGEGILAAGYEIEQRPFRAHLTLGRIKQPREVGLQFLSDVSLPNFDPITVDKIALFRSEPRHDGSRYTVLERLPLGLYKRPLDLTGAST